MHQIYPTSVYTTKVTYELVPFMISERKWRMLQNSKNEHKATKAFQR